jgi:DNA (cytosine-5)-methyltransferase 1
MAAGGKYKVLSLFAGIGGFDLGLERTGRFETVAVAETDPYASKVLALRFPHAPNVGDVTTAEYPDADIICAGFPCQDISFAGAGAGLAGARSGLWREVVRAIRVVRPRYALLENVAALLSRGLDTVLGDLAEVGHDAEWHCIPASAVGAPHRRDRIWIVAHPGSEQHESCRAPLSGEIAEELSRAVAEQCLPDRADPETDPLGADADSFGSYRADLHVERDAQLRDEQECESGPLGKDVADTKRVGQSGSGQPVNASDQAADREGQAGDALHVGIGDIWSAEPNVGRVAHGIPKRVDRLRCLGNAIVPQIPELIGRAILAAESLAA